MDAVVGFRLLAVVIERFAHAAVVDGTRAEEGMLLLHFEVLAPGVEISKGLLSRAIALQTIG